MAAALDEDIERGLRDEPGRDSRCCRRTSGHRARGRAVASSASTPVARTCAGPRSPSTGTAPPWARSATRRSRARPAVDRATFFVELARLLAPDAGRVRRIGFCFSYPAEVLPDGDAVLLHWTKEVHAAGVEGARVGEGLCRGLEQLGRRGPFRVAVLNDTVTTLIAATRDPQTEGCAGFVGLVVGTGSNMACFVPAARARDPRARVARRPARLQPRVRQLPPFPARDARRAARRDDARPGPAVAREGGLRPLPRGAQPPGAARPRGAGRGAGVARAGLRRAGPADLARAVAAHRRRLAREPVGGVGRRAPRRARRRCAPSCGRWRPARRAWSRAGSRAWCSARRPRPGGPAPRWPVAAEGSAFWGVPRYRDIVVETLARLTPVPVRVVRIADANLRGAALAALGRRA